MTTHTDPDPRTAVRWANGMVMVFDGAGVQIPTLQGPYEEVRAAVLRAATPGTRFYHGVWGHEPDPVPRDVW
jgi:hypothetical protein